ncbi:MAG: FAD binding domain-containing protein [Lachnospiraceae bacterium]|nr:FAD binding domain-containing protein [Candidatus Colinaster scatohippi]
MITFQKYVKAETLEEAYTLNQVKNNKIVGGMLWLRLGTPTYNTVIDISGLGLNLIEEDDEQYKIGAMVSLRELETNKSLNDYTDNAIQNALKDVIGVQFRNLATIGGSIWGRFGFSDVLTVFLALDTYVELYKGGIVSLAEFSKMKYDRDILLHIIVKKKPCKCVYDSVRIQRTDFPVLTCAASIIDDEYKIVIGARSGKALLYGDEKGMLSGGITTENAAAFAGELSKCVPTSTNNRGSAAYRSRLVNVLTERNLLKLGGLM